MRKKTVSVALIACLTLALASTASAATSWRRLGVNPFHRPPLSSEADLKALVKNQSVDLKTGFTRAGSPELYSAFMEQFPAARIDVVTVAPGDTFEWVVFKKKSSGQVAVLKDTTWRGGAAFEAYRFHIDKDGMRHEFVVPYACGNVALRTVAPIPRAPVAVTAPAPVAAPPVVVAPPPPPVVAKPPVVVAPPPPPVVAKPPAVIAPPPVVVAPRPAPAAPRPAVVPPAPAPVATSLTGLVFDVGLSRQPDPANYVFARIGYELPLADRLYLIGLVGGALRWMGSDGGSAFTADAMLDYHWLDRVSVGVGAGYWSGNDGQVDLIANVGYRVSGPPDGANTSLFLEARQPIDELESPNEFGRFGLGLRFRF